MNLFLYSEYSYRVWEGRGGAGEGGGGGGAVVEVWVLSDFGWVNVTVCSHSFSHLLLVLRSFIL